MNYDSAKSSISGVILLALAVGLSLYLTAKPVAPTPPPAAPSPGVGATSSLVLAAPASSTQPKITWSQNRIEVILSPGESRVKDLTFTSSLAIQNVAIQAVPEIAGFLTIQPNGFASVPANQPHDVQISFAIPAGTTLGTYDGTIHLRVGSQTLPQTLKVAVNVWDSFKDTDRGLAFKYPPEWTVEQANPNVLNLFPPGTSFETSFEYAGDVVLFFDDNPQGLPTEQYYDGTHNQALFSDSTSVENINIGSLPALRFSGRTTGIAPGDTVVIPSSAYFIRIEGLGNPEAFEAILKTLAPL